MQKKAPNGYVFCVSWYWQNVQPVEVYRFWTFEFEELPDRYHIPSAIVPKTVIKEGQLKVRAQRITPEDLDKSTQAVFIFRVPTQLWMEACVPLLNATFQQQPSPEVEKLSKDLLSLLQF